MYRVFENFHNGVTATVRELAPLLKKHGIEGIGVPADILEDASKAREAAECVRANGLKWSLLPTPVDFLSEDVDDGAFDEGLDKLARWADMGERIGVKYCYNHIWNGSNLRDYEENFEWNLRRIRKVWQILNDHGIKYGMEFLGPHPLRNGFKYPFFNSITGALSLADQVDPKCGFLFDTYHWYCGSGASMADLYYAAGHVDRMVNFHMNDGIAGRAREEQQDLERAMPLKNGVIDAALPYKLFKERGYAGPVMCEPLWPWIDNQKGRPLEDIVKDVALAFERVENAAKA